MIAILLTTALPLIEAGFAEDVVKEEIAELVDELLDWGVIIKTHGVGESIDAADDEVIEMLVSVVYDAARRIHTRRQNRTSRRAARIEAKLQAATDALTKKPH